MYADDRAAALRRRDCVVTRCIWYADPVTAATPNSNGRVHLTFWVYGYSLHFPERVQTLLDSGHVTLSVVGNVYYGPNWAVGVDDHMRHEDIYE